MAGAGNAEGGQNGVTAAGPDNKFDGVGAHNEVTNYGPYPPCPMRIRQSWQTGEGAPASSSFALGANRPD